MKFRISVSIVFFLQISTFLFAQNNNISVINNYQNWGWDSVFVIKNDFISLAVVPQAAGRILEYNLGDTKSLWLKPDKMGKSFTHDEKVKQKEWRNFGGYRLVPIPVDNCAFNLKGERTKRWPPPVTIGDAPYSANISTNENGKSIIEVSSGIQNLPVPLFDNKEKIFSDPKIEEQLQYSRSLHVEENTSLVHIKHTLSNKGHSPVKRGIMTTSQHISRSKPELTDGENYLAYIPFDHSLVLPDDEQFHITTKPEWRWRFINKNRFPLDKNNPEHVKKYLNTGTNWTGEVAPGIFEVFYDYNLMAGLHIIAAKPWVCYVNKTNLTVFAKLFEPYDPNLQYEFGANVAIYNSGMETGYLETEVKTPIYTLQPGEKFDYLETHAAAKVTSLPVLDINETGVITKAIDYDKTTKTFTGEYGVFRDGKAVLKFYNSKGKVKQEIILATADPLHPLIVNHKIKVCKKKKEARLFIRDKDNQDHLLDQVIIK